VRQSSWPRRGQQQRSNDATAQPGHTGSQPPSGRLALIAAIRNCPEAPSMTVTPNQHAHDANRRQGRNSRTTTEMMEPANQ